MFAKENDYDYALHHGSWNDFELFELGLNGDDYICEGLPKFALVKGGSVRLATYEETMSILSYLNNSK